MTGFYPAEKLSSVAGLKYIGVLYAAERSLLFFNATSRLAPTWVWY
jgi:hypothetical protein